VICYPRLISREELCTVCNSQFLLPSFLPSFLHCNNNGASNGAARRTPEAANFSKKTLVASRREGVRTSDSEQFGGDDLVTGHDHGGLGDHNEGLFLFSFFFFSFLIPRKKIQKFVIFWIKRKEKKPMN
jgi:hypothetical protein